MILSFISYCKKHPVSLKEKKLYFITQANLKKDKIKYGSQMLIDSLMHHIISNGCHKNKDTNGLIPENIVYCNILIKWQEK